MNRLLTLTLLAAAYALGRRTASRPAPAQAELPTPVRMFGSLGELTDFLAANSHADTAEQVGGAVEALVYGEGAAQRDLMALADEPYLGMPAVYLDRHGVSRGARVSRIDDAKHRIVTLHVDLPDSDRPVTIERLVPQQQPGKELVHHWQPA